MIIHRFIIYGLPPGVSSVATATAAAVGLTSSVQIVGTKGTATVSIRPSNFVDTDRYPIADAGPAREALIDRLRLAIASDGCAVLKADVIVNTAEAGNGFPWHFDTNNYTVTLAIQNAEEGGDFEYSPYLRTPLDENYAGVEAVLDGDASLIRTLRLEPGDLQIFKGRYSLHRVTPLVGSRARYVAIFSYVEEPGMVGSPERTAQLYGRVLPIHLERAGLRTDALVD